MRWYTTTIMMGVKDDGECSVMMERDDKHGGVGVESEAEARELYERAVRAAATVIGGGALLLVDGFIPDDAEPLL